MVQVTDVGAVKRYIVEEVLDGYSGRVVTAVPNGGGEFVKYEDYEALQAENERLKAERVDLEQFREPVLVALSYYAEMTGDIHDPSHNDVADCDRLLALIDWQANAAAPAILPGKLGEPAKIRPYSPMETNA